MSRFYSFPGRNYGGEGNANSGRGKDFDNPYDGDIKDHPQFSEYFAGKQKLIDEGHVAGIGMDPGDQFNYRGRDVGGEVLHEEYDQHSGTIEQTVRVSDQTGSGTRKLKWKQQSDKTLIQTDDVRAD